MKRNKYGPKPYIKKEPKEIEPPCSRGCYAHRTHPCDNCGRINGRIPYKLERIKKEK